MEPKGENLIEEDFHVVDDGHKIMDWTIRNRKTVLIKYLKRVEAAK